MAPNRKFNVPTTRELIKCLLNRREWKSKSPLRKWLCLYGVGKSLCNVIKMTSYKEDQTLCWFSYYPLLYVFVHVILVVYTTVYFIVHGPFNKFLPCTCAFLGPVCGTLQLAQIIYTKRRYILHDFLAFPGRNLYPDSIEEGNEEFYDICSKQMDITIKRFFHKMTTLLTISFIGVTWSTYQTITDEIKITAVQLKLPYVEEYSNTEFISNLLLEVNILGHGAIGYYAIEVGMDIVNDFISISPKILKYRLKKMIQEHRLNASADTVSSLGNIIKHLRDYDKFVYCLRELFYVRCLVIPPLYTYAIAMSIFVQFEYGYSGGYTMAALCLVQMFYICELAEQVDDNGLSDTLYNSKWYVLPIKIQKDLMHLINGYQNGTKIVFGPFATINRTYYGLIVNKVYSFVTFLNNFELNY